MQANWAGLIGEQEMTILLGHLRNLVAGLGVEYRGSVADVDVLSTHT